MDKIMVKPAYYRSRQGQLIFWSLIAVAGLALWIVLVSLGSRSIWTATLSSFLFFFTIASGMFMWTVLMSLSRARWALQIEHLSAASIGFALPSLVLLGVLWAGAKVWAPWPGGHFPSGAYLNTSFLFGRDLFIIAVFWILCRIYLHRRFRENAGRIGGIIALWYLVGFTFLALDLVEALQPPWKSSLFGPYFFVSALYAGILFWTLVSVRTAGDEAFHDQVKLIVALSLLTLYAFYCQVLTIWYENLPEETPYVIPRLNYDWKWISLAVVIALYFGPLVLLLLRRWKLNRPYAAAVCVLLLCMHWVQCWWWVEPAFSIEHVHLSVSAIAAILLTGGLFMISYVLSIGYVKRFYSEKVVVT